MLNNVAGFLSPSGLQLVAATGGDEIKTLGGYKYHLFNSSGTFTVTAGGNVDVFTVGAGGGGGGEIGGGGGGSQIVSYTSVAVTPLAYTVTIGAQGAGGTSSQQLLVVMAELLLLNILQQPTPQQQVVLDQGQM